VCDPGAMTHVGMRQQVHEARTSGETRARTRAQVRALPHASKRASKRIETAALTCLNAVQAQASIEGGSPRTWETRLTGSHDQTDFVVIDGSWPLPPRGRIEGVSPGASRTVTTSD
jgi:hypothetical protein